MCRRLHVRERDEMNHFFQTETPGRRVEAVLFPASLWESIIRYEIACSSCAPEAIRSALDDLAVNAVNARRNEQNRIDQLATK